MKKWLRVLLIIISGIFESLALAWIWPAFVQPVTASCNENSCARYEFGPAFYLILVLIVSINAFWIIKVLAKKS
jgi:hypothetical protein